MYSEGTEGIQKMEDQMEFQAKINFYYSLQ